MNVRWLAATLLFVMITTDAAACDRVSAQNAFDMLAAMTTSRTMKDGKLVYQWNSDFTNCSDAQKLQIATIAANADACLIRKAREIEFYSPLGVLVTRASPYRGIEMVR